MLLTARVVVDSSAFLIAARLNRRGRRGRGGHRRASA